MLTLTLTLTPTLTITITLTLTRCAVCGGAGELLLCDDCPRAWHLHCSVPVLDAVPEGDWRCAVCRGELGEVRSLG